MRKVVSLVLALIMCLGLCACGGEDDNKTQVNDKDTEAQVETITISELIEDRDNGARAQLNVGKKTTVFGEVINITRDYCVVKLFVSSRCSIFKVILPIEILANLESKQVVLIDAIVDAVDNENGETLVRNEDGEISNTYILKADDIADESQMEDYIRDKIELIDKEYADETVDKDYFDYSEYFEKFTDYFNVSHLSSAVEYSGGFDIYEDDELREYLLGTWVEISSSDLGQGNRRVVEFWYWFGEDGTCRETKEVYYTGYPNENNDRRIEYRENGEWSIDETKVKALGFSGKVHVLTENAFVCGGDLYVRVE